ncbi:MAG: tyrosine-protein phosphatase [Chloroflexia bacterium]
MIDLHCHLLPGVDDGPNSMEESLALARAAWAEGVRTIVVTPHARDWELHRRGQELEPAVERLQKGLREAGIDLTLVPGMEVDLDEALPSRLRDGRARPLGRGPYVLVELPFLAYAMYIDQVIFHTQLAGWRPILAHVERYVYFQERPELLAALLQRGVLAQVSAGSLLGELGPTVRNTVLLFLRRGLVHCLATDAHAASGSRAPCLSSALACAASYVGQERALAMVRTVPEYILAGRSVEDVLHALTPC